MPSCKGPRRPTPRPTRSAVRSNGPTESVGRHTIAVLLCLLLMSASAAAQTDGDHSRASCQGIATVAGTDLATELVADGFKKPVHLAPPPDDVSRLFVVEQDGTIKIIKSGKTLARPFLDIRECLAGLDDLDGPVLL